MENRDGETVDALQVGGCVSVLRWDCVTFVTCPPPSGLTCFRHPNVQFSIHIDTSVDAPGQPCFGTDLHKVDFEVAPDAGRCLRYAELGTAQAGIIQRAVQNYDGNGDGPGDIPTAKVANFHYHIEDVLNNGG